MGQDLAKSIFLVLNAQGRPIGTGFLVGPGLGVTCAHVVRVALDLQAEDPREPFGQDLTVTIAGVNQPFRARVLRKGWSDNTAGDVAFLRFYESHPGGLQPVRLGRAARSARHKGETLGYPGSEGSQLLAAQGDILRLLAQRDPPRLQFESHTVEPGFSGSPILDLEQDRVVEMVTRGKDPQHAVTVLVAPAELLKELWPELALADPPSAAPFMVEALPAHFVARAVCWDERVRAAFPDGILWVTLGENPSEQAIVEKIKDLVERLSEKRPGYSELASVTDHLRVLLKNRKVLLVVDDAWQAEHLRPFLQPESRVVLLITTRNADTLPEHTIKIDVDAMRQEEALGLLHAGEGATYGALGEWPLLLRLANGVLHRQVAGGKSLRDALADAMQRYHKRGALTRATPPSASRP